MVRIVFKDSEGGVKEVSAAPGASVMQAAVDNMVSGVIAECGGYCACATCQVEVDPEWISRLENPKDMEAGMLGGLRHAGPGRRLSCQIQVTPDLDGLTVTVPPSADQV